MRRTITTDDPAGGSNDAAAAHRPGRVEATTDVVALTGEPRRWFAALVRSESIAAVLLPAVEPDPQLLPLVGPRVDAGFPSPADDYIESSLDIVQYLIDNPAATFLVRIKGLSMINAGIYPDDIAAVDRAREPIHGDIVVAIVDGELTIKRLYRRPDGVALHPANPDFAPILFRDGMTLEIWGVVGGVVRKY